MGAPLGDTSKSEYPPLPFLVYLHLIFGRFWNALGRVLGAWGDLGLLGCLGRLLVQDAPQSLPGSTLISARCHPKGGLLEAKLDPSWAKLVPSWSRMGDVGTF